MTICAVPVTKRGWFILHAVDSVEAFELIMSTGIKEGSEYYEEIYVVVFLIEYNNII